VSNNAGPVTRRRPRRLTGAPAVGAVVLLGLAACGTSSPQSPADRPGSNGETGAAAGSRTAVTGTVTVLAAASLTEAFDAIKAQVQAAHPGLTVHVSYGSSATLVQQVNQGAPADVIALAGESAAQPLDPSLVKDTRVFATNVLEIAVPPDDPGHVTSVADLGRPGLKVVLCAETAPCGKAATTTLEKAKVNASVVSREIDVKATLAKVRLGEADAAIVYHSDVISAKGAVTGIPIPGDVNTTLRYPIITLDENPATTAFVDAVLSSSGLKTIESFGLGAP
jgi:molybdate transport system substrate-binding protein